MDALAIHICLLAAALGSPSFNTREAATAELHQAPEHVVALLAWHTDPEVCRRSAVEMERRRNEVVASITPPNGAWPRLDVTIFGTEEPLLHGVDAYEWAYAFNTDPDCVTPDSCRQATQAFVACLVRQGVSVSAIDSLLLAMATKEAEYGPWEPE